MASFENEPLNPRVAQQIFATKDELQRELRDLGDRVNDRLNSNLKWTISALFTFTAVATGILAALIRLAT